MMAALAAATSRVTIGPLVACTSFHNPALLAKQAATIDEIAGGRFVLGLGAGWNETEFRAFGFPFDHRVDRFEEAFTIIRTLLQEGAIDFDGRFYQARDCELLPRPRPGGPPLLIGSNGPRMLRIAAPHVQAWNTWYADTDNTPGRRRPPARHRRRGLPATSGAIRPRSSGPSRSTSGCRAAAAGRWATRRDRSGSRRSRARRRGWPTSSAPTPAPASARSRLVLDPIDRAVDRAIRTRPAAARSRLS